MSFQQNIKSLQKLYSQSYCDSQEFDVFEQDVEKNHQIKEDVRVLEKFCLNNSKHVKVHETEIPPGILPDNVLGFLFDANVYVSNEYKQEKGIKKKMSLSDDIIYKNFPEIQQNIPRGLTTCKIIEKKSGNELFHDTCIYANKKFSGDEDDDEESNNAKLYFIASPINVRNKRMISTEKMNGDALHFSVRYIFDKFFLFVGSKGCHMMINNENDIDKYTDQRFNVCKSFARGTWKMLEKISQKERDLLFQLLDYTKVTAVCEFLQPSYQHVVDISNDESTVVFLTFTPTYTNSTSLTAFSPAISLEIMNILNVPCTPHKIINLDDKGERYKQEVQNVRSNTNSEGCVFYIINDRDETIGLIKVKSVWYICLRALREKCKSLAGKKVKASPHLIYAEINKRYDDIQQWLELSDDDIAEWKNNGKNFVNWLKSTVNVNTVKSSFPILWKQYCDEKGS